MAVSSSVVPVFSQVPTKVYVYNGEGVDSASLARVTEHLLGHRALLAMGIASVEKVNGEGILMIAPSEQHRTVVVIPGGHCSAWKDMTPQVVERLRSLVIQEGAHYVGICGGAFFACRQTQYGDMHKTRDLALFEGIGVGPLIAARAEPQRTPVSDKSPGYGEIVAEASFLPGGGAYERASALPPACLDVVKCYHHPTRTPADTELLRASNEFHTIVAGGGYFKGGTADLECKTLISYAGVDPDHARAAVRLKVGAGSAALCFPHIEWRGEMFEVAFSDVIQRFARQQQAMFSRLTTLASLDPVPRLDARTLDAQSFERLYDTPRGLLTYSAGMQRHPALLAQAVQVTEELSKAQACWEQEAALLHDVTRLSAHNDTRLQAAFESLFNSSPPC